MPCFPQVIILLSFLDFIRTRGRFKLSQMLDGFCSRLIWFLQEKVCIAHIGETDTSSEDSNFFGLSRVTKKSLPKTKRSGHW